MCSACGRCKWLLQKLPFPPQQQIQWVSQQTRHFMRDVISWQRSLAKLLHVWIFSRTRQLLHFSIRARQIRHLRMLLVRNTKTSLACDFWSPYTNCTWCFPSRSKPCTTPSWRQRCQVSSLSIIENPCRTDALQGISAVSSTRISAPSPIPHFHHFQNKSGAFWFKQRSAKTMCKKSNSKRKQSLKRFPSMGHQKILTHVLRHPTAP